MVDRTPPPGHSVAGRYSIVRSLGHGGSGDVFLANDSVLDRLVALKRLRKHREFPADLALREAQSTARFTHPHIAALYDLVQDDDETFLVLEYVPGATLRERVHSGVGDSEFLDIARKLTEAVGAAHVAGLVHCDLKPENAVASLDGTVKVLDFGLAALRREALHPGGGTPPYAAPELTMGRAIDRSTDLFSLGVIFFEMLSGIHPSGHALPLRLDSVRLDVTPQLSELIAAMTDPDPNRRPANAGEVIDWLDSLPPLPSIPFLETPTRSIGTETPGLPDSEGTGSKRVGGLRLVWWFVPLSILAAILWVFEGRKAPPLPPNPDVTILPVLVEGAEPGLDLDGFRWGLTEHLTHQMRRRAFQSSIEFHDVAEVVAEQVKDWRDAEVRLGANLAVQTEIEIRPEYRTVRCALVGRDSDHGKRETATSESKRKLLRSVEFQIDPTLTHELYRRIDQVVSGWFGLPSTDDDLATSIPGDATLRFWTEGRGILLRAANEQDVSRAVAKFEAAQRTDARVALVWASLAEASRLTNRFRDSREKDSATQIDPASEARPFAERALALDPDNARARFETAAVQRAEGGHPAAIKNFAFACSTDPTFDMAWFEYARTFGRAGDWDAEEDVYRQMVAARGDSKSHWWLADFFLKRGRLEEAKDHYVQLRRLRPNFHDAHTNLGAVRLYLGELDSARVAFRRSVSLAPSDQSLANLGTIEFELRNFAEAAQVYQRSIQLGFGSAFSWVNLGDVYYFGTGSEDQAREAYEQAIALGQEELRRRPYDVRLRANLAPVWARIAQPDSAAAYFTEARSREPENPEVLYCGALTHWDLGQTAEALELLDQSVRHGFPMDWIERSPVFDRWRDQPRLADIIGH